MDLAIWLVVLVVILVLTFLPRQGVLARYRVYRAQKERELVEDSLKHLLDREQAGRHASPESLAGTLNLSRTRVTRLIEAMEAQGLLQSLGSELHLTAEGERWAIHVVRAHRLWERYLVDEARMPLEQIHDEAHRREHRLSEAQLDDLDAALGYPRHDPHGDPIPTRQGDLPKADWTPLTAWPVDRPARIAHLEDEPTIAYEQILAAGLRLGQDVRILEHTPQRVVLSDGENEYRLAPTVASNVHVTTIPARELLNRSAIPLIELPHDRQAEIIRLDETVQGFTRRRFMDLGLTPGAVISPELQNFFGDPRAYRLRGTLIALRKDQATKIWVKPL